MANISTCAPITPNSILDAYRKIDKYIIKTELVTSDAINQIASFNEPASLFIAAKNGTPIISALSSVGNTINSAPFPTPKFNIYFKCENQQRTGAFKARGAFHALSRLIEEEGIDEVQRKGVVTTSSGNHAQGLALAAVTFEVPATIVMPKTSSQTKVAAVARTLNIKEIGVDGGKSSKGIILFCGNSMEEKNIAVDAAIQKSGCVFVPPYAHPDIISGQGTCALELEEQFNNLRYNAYDRGLDAVLAPIGGGGLLGGIATWFALKPTTKIYGAEPSFQGADDARRGLLLNKRIEHVASLTIADGLRTPVGPINWGIVSDKSKVEGIFAVEENEIKMAMRIIHEELDMLVEPSGCVPLAVVLFNASFRSMVAKEVGYEGRAWNIAIVLSGGNTTIEIMQELIGEVGSD